MYARDNCHCFWHGTSFDVVSKSACRCKSSLDSVETQVTNASHSHRLILEQRTEFKNNKCIINRIEEILMKRLSRPGLHCVWRRRKSLIEASPFFQLHSLVTMNVLRLVIDLGSNEPGDLQGRRAIELECLSLRELVKLIWDNSESKTSSRLQTNLHNSSVRIRFTFPNYNYFILSTKLPRRGIREIFPSCIRQRSLLFRLMKMAKAGGR